MSSAAWTRSGWCATSRTRWSGRRALEHRPDHLVRDVAHQPDRVHAAELITEICQQALGDELQQHGVVTFECGEDVGVRLELGQAVEGQVSRAATGLAADLDGLRGVPGRDRLEARRQRLELTLFRLVRTVTVRRLVERLDQPLLGKVHRVSRGQGWKE